MTQQEFDSEIIELKKKKHADLQRVIVMQSEVKEEIAALRRQRHATDAQISKLDQQRLSLNIQRMKPEKEWHNRVRDFNLQRPNCTSNLAEATTQNLLAELHRRGFYGAVHHLSETGEEETWPLTQRAEA